MTVHGPMLVLFTLFVVFGVQFSGAFRWSRLQQESEVINTPVDSTARLPCDFEVTYDEYVQTRTFFLLTWSREIQPHSNQWEILGLNSTDYGVKILHKTGRSFEMRGNSLLVNSVQQRDGALYRCTLRSSFFSSPSTLQLNVQFRPTRTRIEESQNNRLGKPLLITCTAQGNPPPTYAFYHGKELLQSSTNGRYSIARYQSKNDGEYFCIPMNILGSGPTGKLQLNYGGTVGQHMYRFQKKDILATGLGSFIGGTVLIIVLVLVIYFIRKRNVIADNSSDWTGTEGETHESQYEMHENHGFRTTDDEVPVVFQNPTYGLQGTRQYQVKGVTKCAD